MITREESYTLGTGRNIHPLDPMRKLVNDAGLPIDMDPGCVELCIAMNRMQGVNTTHSCSGHGLRPFSVSFTVANIDSLAQIIARTNQVGWKIRFELVGKSEDVSTALELTRSLSERTT